MQLLPREIEKTLPALYATEQTPAADKIVRVKFFCPWNQWTWYAVEYSTARREFFGLVRGLEVEWGYWSLDELKQVRGPGGLSIERDIHFSPRTVRQVVADEGIEGAL